MKNYQLITLCLLFLNADVIAHAQDSQPQGRFSLIQAPDPFGLDLKGPFEAAIALGAGPDDVWRVGDAEFRGFNSIDHGPVFYENGEITVAAPSVHWIGAENNNFIQLGTSQDALNLEKVLNSYRTGSLNWGHTIRLIVSGLTVGKKYQVQMLFHEPYMNGSNRGSEERTFSIRFGQTDGQSIATHHLETLVEDFNMISEVGGFATVFDTALLWTYEFEAQAVRCQFDLVVGSANKPVLNAFTLKAIP